MMKKLLVAAATAGLLTVGGLAAATPAAAATSGSLSFSINGPHFAIAVNTRPTYARPYRVCKPIYKRVYYKYHGHTYWKLVKVGQSCHWVYPSPRYPYRRY